MPTILRIDGFGVRICLPTREHGPAHVHVIRDEAEIVVWLNAPSEDMSVREAYGMNRGDIHRAIEIVEENVDYLRKVWSQHHG